MYLKKGERKPIVTSSLDHFTEHWGEAGLGERLRKEEKGWLTCSLHHFKMS